MSRVCPYGQLIGTTHLDFKKPGAKLGIEWNSRPTRLLDEFEFADDLDTARELRRQICAAA